jgi:hypothetical protein
MRVVLFAILLTGCKNMSPEGMQAVAHLAAIAAVATTAVVVQAAQEESAREARYRGVSTGSDVMKRIRCRGGRSYKLRCPQPKACFWEDSEGRGYSCVDVTCETVPPGLAMWCE